MIMSITTGAKQRLTPMGGSRSRVLEDHEVRNNRRYSEEFKLQCVQSFVNRGDLHVEDVALRLGVHTSRLYEWHRAFEGGGRDLTMADKGKNEGGPHDWSAQRKLDTVMRSLSIPPQELGEFLRREGVHEAMLDEWKRDMLEGLARDRRASSKGEAKQIAALERELARKEKALSEAAALLLLQKKVQAIWGNGADDTRPPTAN